MTPPIPMPQILSLTQNHLDRMRAAAVAAYPAECCGLLVGVLETKAQWRVTHVVPTYNLRAEERNDRFAIDPVTHLALRRCLRGRPEHMIGHYHSHPNGQAYPSAKDLAMGFEPELFWVIVAVNGKRHAGATEAYRLDGKAVHSVSIQIRIATSELQNRLLHSHARQKVG